jgi:L-iditol 2-dehydrogenase
MLATRLLATGDVRTVEVPVPDPGPGEILVGIEAAGLCGTDRHLFKGEFPCTPPVTLGHEFAGIVTARGAGVTMTEGTRVTCDPNISCGACDQCHRGRVNLCRNLVAIGIHRDGGFADYVVIPEHRAFVLPQDIDPLHGAFCEPLACMLHGIDLAAIRAADRVTVIGGGMIGLLALQLAVLAGAEVMMVTRQTPKRVLAAQLGASATAATVSDAVTVWPGGADIVLECAGVGDTVAKAPRLTRTGGRIVILGVLPKGEQVAVEPFDLLFREISVLYSFLNPHTQARAADLIAKGRIAIAPLISRIVGLAELPDAIAHDPRPGEVKVLVVPG